MLQSFAYLAEHHIVLLEFLGVLFGFFVAWLLDEFLNFF